MKLAAIDIGSNSIKLAVVDAAASDSFAVICREKEVVRLAHNTLSKGHLSQEAIERATASIKRFKGIADARGVETIVAVATASIREARNSARFIQEIAQKTGVQVEILSGIEEARLIGLAASRGCGRGRATAINIDIGGGSTELSLFRDGLPVSLLSVKLGAVGLTERYLVSNPPKSKEVTNLRTEFGPRSSAQRGNCAARAGNKPPALRERSWLWDDCCAPATRAKCQRRNRKRSRLGRKLSWTNLPGSITNWEATTGRETKCFRASARNVLRSS